MASQNVYDNDEFYKQYKEFSNSIQGIDNFYEWDDIINLLPNFKGIDMLDLGCGDGTLCRYAIKQGANSALGIDISKNMINEAIELKDEYNLHDNNKLKYEIHDLESLKLNDNNHYDFIFSRFVFHYIVNLKSLFKTIYKSLKCGGTFLFVVEHPIKTCSKSFHGVTTQHDGLNDKTIWRVSDYDDEGERIKPWIGFNNVIKQHRKLDTYINTLIECGFIINHINEVLPKKELNQLKDDKFISDYDSIFILIIKATK